jgi:hypothetical protein
MLKSFCLVLMTVCCVFVTARPTQAQNVVINEIFYHPANTNVLETWFELFNAGTNTVNLSGARVTKGVAFNFPTNTMLAPGDYLVVASHGPTFASLHSGVTNFVAGWTGQLSRDGETIQVEDAAGNTIAQVNYAPEGDWAVRRIGAVDGLGKQGWEWFAEHDGLGKSLELVNLAMPNGNGQNWSSSLTVGGTPGRVNSVASANIAPIVAAAQHAPLIPSSADPVTISARIFDEHTNGLAVTLNWRMDGATSFLSAVMSDDGAHGDGLAGDGIFGAVIPAQADKTLVEFYVNARDLENNTRTYPNVIPSGSSRTANLLYEVDNSVYAGNQPVFRLIMSLAESNYLATQIWGGQPNSDALVSGTFINTDGVLDGGSTTQVRYECGFRNRGHGTRTAVPHNFHVAFPKDNLWKGRSGINLNTHYTHSQELGSAVFRGLGLPMADSRPVQVRVNGANLAKPGQEQFGSYAANEVVDDQLVRRQFPLDSAGNLYRGVRDLIPGISATADLAWLGSSFTAYTNAYVKENNQVVNDWSDFIQLINLLNNTDDASYVGAVSNVANVDEWMKYFAVNTLLDNQENSLGIGSGDDFAVYRGTNDSRFLLLPYDMDALLGRGLSTATFADGLWRATNVAAIHRFMKRNEFVPAYFRHLKELAETTFAPERMNPLLDQILTDYVDVTTIANMKAFNASHRDYVLSLLPLTLTAQSDLPVTSGFPRTTAPTAVLFGDANAIETRAVLVNGAFATYSAWQGRWTNDAVALRPGLNHITVQALGIGGVEVGRTNIDIWYDNGAVAGVSGAIAANTTWTAAGGPYNVTASVTVNSGVTLTLEAGACVFFASGTSLAVANGGRLLAEGTTNAPILFTRAPGTATTWGGITINGSAVSPETRIINAHFEGNGSTAIHSSGGTVFLEHLTFGNAAVQYVSLDGSSFVVSHCVFPTATSGFELLHGTGGIKSGGRGVLVHNFFGATQGYNDVVDFTGGNRPNPILQVLNNVFTGSSDDSLDLDGTDAWVEGNIFLHTHKNGAPDSSSAISGGSDSGNVSDITVIGNIFYDCDQAATAKQGNFYTLINNTIVHQTKTGGLDTDAAVVNLADDGTTEGAGMYLEGNIIVDAEKLTRNLTAATVTFSNNLMPFTWAGPGSNNSAADPRLEFIPQLAQTHFTSWEQAQVMRDWFSLLPGSPARGTGPNGRDTGGVVPAGASISGEPFGTNNQTTATFTVGIARSGSGIPAGGFPNGSGYTHYRYRLDGGVWSAERTIATPIALSSLANGPHGVDVSGKRDSGFYQDDADFGGDALITQSRTWVVNTSYIPSARPTVRLNEVLAKNSTTLTNAGATPDLVELHNFGVSAVDLSGMGLSDNVAAPYQFIFPANTTLAPGAYLVLYADSAVGAPGMHVGFSLKQEGDDLSLYDKPANGGVLLDSVTFGLQLADYSIGRAPDGAWTLCRPTIGAANFVQACGNQRTLKINEWLADAQFVADNDFIELYNSDPLPVALGGLFLSDAAGSPARNPIAPLSYIAGGGFAKFIADSDPGQGPDHLNFKLSPDVGLILLSAPDLTTIDSVVYSSQRTDISQGRSPNGGDIITDFTQPSPGGNNPGSTSGGCTVVTETISLLPLNATWRYNQNANLDGIAWQAANYVETGWGSGPALLAVEDCNCLPAPGIGTPLAIGRMTYYFRTTFVVDTNLSGWTLNMRTVLDDGAIIYLNGTELPIPRIGMNNGTQAYTNAAARNVGNAAVEFFAFPSTLLQQGTNIVAVEVHQTSSSSTDIAWGMGLDASHSSTNCNPLTTTPVVINEILANNQTITNVDGKAPDWVELFNTSTNALDLVGCSLTDDPSFPRKWVFTSGSTITGRGQFVIYCDDTSPISSTNTGFALKSSGSAFYLFDKALNGGALLDALNFGLQTPDLSVGRVPNGAGAWTLNLPTGGNVNTAAGLASPSALRINEWMADPASGDDWFELYNSAAQPVALGGLVLTDNLADKTQSPIAPLSFIGVGENAFLQFIADGLPGDGNDHVNFSLKKSGEALGAFSPVGVQLSAVGFGVQQTGVSQGRFPDGGVTIVSFVSTTSPAESNFLPLTNAVVNEVLTHTDPPLEDAVELFNPSGGVANIGGWFLSNDKSNFKKFRITDGSVLAANGFFVFYETQFNAGSTPFTFNSARGDSAILSAADAFGNLTGYRSEVKFGGAENGVSFGRYQTSAGADFTTLAARTFGRDNPATVTEFRLGTGLSNSGARIGPVVISEIMYNSISAGFENPDEEFIELQNITASPVPLYDPAYPTNTWRVRDAVDFEFPTNVTLAPNERILIVNFSPIDEQLLAAFRAKFNVPLGVLLFGPWSGRLANDSDIIELVKPDAVQLPPHPDAGLVPQVLVDKVRYSALAPWPAAASSGVNSLQRLAAANYGNDPVNWQAAAPTAGRANGSGGGDSDGDGLSDVWELGYFGNLSRDGSGDFDGDGQTDLQEFLAGTEPTNPVSNLKITSVIHNGANFVLRFTAVAARTYTVQYRDRIDSGSWSRLADVAALPSTSPVDVSDPGVVGRSGRFYRVISPASP